MSCYEQILVLLMHVAYLQGPHALASLLPSGKGETCDVHVSLRGSHR